MFTGLIAELGSVVLMNKVGPSFHITIKANKVMNNLRIGDSVAVNGVCLTVVKQTANQFTADVMPETVRLTNLRLLKSGDKVNLERTLRLCDGLDGHIVSGHVEGIGTIVSRKIDGIAEIVTVKTPQNLMKYILKKGSIAIDGISLTVVDVTEDTFSVSIIPHTAEETTIGFKSVGSEVNLETDIIGKYVERLLNFENKTTTEKKSALSKSVLFENGFI